MSKEEMEAAFVLLASAVVAFDKSSRGACAETTALTQQAKETLNLKTWRPPANVVHLTSIVQPLLALPERKEG